MTDHLTHVTHPLVQHKLTLMRDKRHLDGPSSANCCARSASYWPMR